MLTYDAVRSLTKMSRPVTVEQPLAAEYLVQEFRKTRTRKKRRPNQQMEFLRAQSGNFKIFLETPTRKANVRPQFSRRSVAPLLTALLHLLLNRVFRSASLPRRVHWLRKKMLHLRALLPGLPLQKVNTVSRNALHLLATLDAIPLVPCRESLRA